MWSLLETKQRVQALEGLVDHILAEKTGDVESTGELREEIKKVRRDVSRLSKRVDRARKAMEALLGGE